MADHGVIAKGQGEEEPEWGLEKQAPQADIHALHHHRPGDAVGDATEQIHKSDSQAKHGHTDNRRDQRQWNEQPKRPSVNTAAGGINQQANQGPCQCGKPDPRTTGTCEHIRPQQAPKLTRDDG